MSGGWKAAVICPIIKGGSEDVANYRPVSLTAVVCKAFERILKRAILSFISECKAITGYQRSFLQQNPVVPFESPDTRSNDYSVNYRFLLAKLELFGRCEKVVLWIRSCLTGRTYRVQVDDILSQETRIKSGIFILKAWMFFEHLHEISRSIAAVGFLTQ